MAWSGLLENVILTKYGTILSDRHWCQKGGIGTPGGGPYIPVLFLYYTGQNYDCTWERSLKKENNTFHVMVLKSKLKNTCPTGGNPKD